MNEIAQPHKKIRKRRASIKNPNGAGRREAVIDLSRVREAARTMATDKEIAAYCGVSYQTFIKHKAATPSIQEAIDEAVAFGCRSLRAKQFAVAMSGNVAMLKWLGEQYLDQFSRARIGNDPNAPFNFGSVKEVATDFTDQAAADRAWHEITGSIH